MCAQNELNSDRRARSALPQVDGAKLQSNFTDAPKADEEAPSLSHQLAELPEIVPSLTGTIRWVQEIRLWPSLHKEVHSNM